MQMSVSPPNSQGFTIIEAIIVLVLLGAILAIVAPNLSRTFESFSTAAELRKIASQINLMSKKSFLVRKEVLLGRDTLKLQKGWDIETETPIIFSQKGFCSGGEIVIKNNQETLLISKLEPPFCELKLDE